MARDGLRALIRAGIAAGVFFTLLCLLGRVQGGPPKEREGVAATLEVQKALQLGRDLVVKGSYEAAVHVLEEQITRINGSREYLAVLREAYRGYVKELRLAGKETEAEVYQRRLLILDPGAVLDQAAARAATPPASTAQAKPQAPEPRKPAPKFRGSREDAPKTVDPFQESNSKHARALLEQAEQEYAGNHFESACRLYEQAHRADEKITTDCYDRWGYSKLFTVVQRLNRPSEGGPAYAELEQEVRVAMALAPAKLEACGKDLLQRIQERRNATAAPNGAQLDDRAANIAVHHLDRGTSGWAIAETANFRVYHNQPRELAEKAAQVAERTRTAMLRKWFGEADDPWSQKCDLFLHATAQDYAQASGAPANSPGHSELRCEGSRVVLRRMHMHCDNANMLIAVLPHETTHCVLAGKFGDQPVPRWADEGMAVLSEPSEQIERHVRNLPKHSQDRQLFYLRDLMRLEDYPQAHRVGAFYAQSVSLVDFLCKQKGPQTFAQFLRDGMRGGYEEALRRYYGFQDFTELDQRWRAYAFGPASGSTAVAGGAR
jgi:tetratricopeptide (TPR) repeat protein